MLGIRQGLEVDAKLFDLLVSPGGDLHIQSGDDEDDEEDERLTIGDNVTLDIIDINDLNKAASKVDLSPPVLEFEVLS